MCVLTGTRLMVTLSEYVSGIEACYPQYLQLMFAVNLPGANYEDVRTETVAIFLNTAFEKTLELIQSSGQFDAILGSFFAAVQRTDSRVGIKRLSLGLLKLLQLA